MKKVTGANPLANFKLWEDLKEYNQIQTDEELAAFYHKMLNKYEGKRPLVCSFIMAMISYSVNYPIRKIQSEL